MVKKTKSSSTASSASTASRTPKGAAGLMDSQIAAAVKDSAQHIWLAGMGAFSKAQEEGGKVFEALVKEGMSLQKKTQGLAEEKIGEVTGKMTAMADTVTTKAGQNWDKLETIFEARTAKALNKLGVPTAKDVAALVERVDALAAAVAKLGGTPVKATKAAKSVTATRRTKAAAPVAAPAATNVAAKPARKPRKAAAPKVAAEAPAAPAAKRAPRRRSAAAAAAN
jgi:poly(hydroxyalkanoate) granule-associated protein